MTAAAHRVIPAAMDSGQDLWDAIAQFLAGLVRICSVVACGCRRRRRRSSPPSPTGRVVLWDVFDIHRVTRSEGGTR